ncbi:MAG: LLM class flavin-dependent oxidoreductase [Actinomycetota bacterium]|nr:LLM class flavin-dependent oxidoreductase [Actinomycetota bacterium]
MRFGLALPHYDTSFRNEPASWEVVKRVAQTAERSGFDSVWVSDHLFLDWSKYGGSDEVQGSLECWTTMGGLVSSTEGVRIGSLTTCNDFRSPALVAKMAASLDVLSGGRVDIGLGAGWYEPEYEAAGIEFSAPGDRIRRLGEATQIVRRLLRGEEVTLDGRFYQLDGAVVRPRPVQDPAPPVWLGGKGDFLVKTAARHADGWNLSWLTDFDAYRERSRFADNACESLDRDPSTLKRSVGVYALVGTNEADAAARFERLLNRTPAGVMQSATGGPGVSWDEFRRTRVAGTVSEVVDRLGELESLGVEEIVVGLGALPFQVSDEDDVALFGAEVVTRLK